MKIRYCPGCVQLIHFEPDRPVQRCWNCYRITDFSQPTTPEEKLAFHLSSRFDAALPNTSRLVKVGRIALVAALPTAVFMLLLCNSFDAFPTGDLSFAFDHFWESLFRL